MAKIVALRTTENRGIWKLRVSLFMTLEAKISFCKRKRPYFKLFFAFITEAYLQPCQNIFDGLF